MKRIRRQLSYANVMATVAVFIALGGASYAATQLPKNSVGKRQLKANAVDTGQLARNSVRVGKIDGEAVRAGKIAKNAIATDRLRNEIVTTPKIANLGVTTDKLDNLAVTGGKLGNLSVGTGKLGNAVVTQAKVAADAIGAGQLGTVATRIATNGFVAGESLGEASVACLPGEQVIGGGARGGSSAVKLIQDHPEGNGWHAAAYNDGITGGVLSVYALCLAP